MALKRISLSLLAGGLLVAAPAFAQVRPIPPHPPFFPRPIPQPATTDLQLIAQKATVNINGASARVTLAQTFSNPQPRQIEGTYLWSVPPGAAISDLAVTLGGKKLAAEILDANKAREIYQGIVRQMRDPAILEFVGRDLVRAKIFPIPPNGRVEVELTYSQPLSGNRFALPLRTPNGTGDVAASLDLTFANRDVKAVYSPSHPIETIRSGEQTRVTGEWKSADRDFVLGWTRGEGAVALDLLTYRKPGEDDGFFMLLAAPDARADETQIEAKDVTFVFDTSGSMNDDGKIEQARRALATLLSNLRPADRFNIVTFASDVRPFRDALVAATPDNLSAARAWVGDIKAVGGTNIDAALDSALKFQQASKRPQQVVFLTDGLPTVGETRVELLLDKAKKANDSDARMWTFGVGFDVNTRLLDGLAAENGGDSDYVLPREDIETKVGALYEKIAYPVLTDLKLDFGGLETYDVVPRRLPDLFRGGQMIVMGRYKGTPKTPTLSGQIGGATRSFTGAQSAGGDELPRLWATRKIGFLIDDARRAGRPIDGEVRAEILKLSTQYGVVTPLTAALITEDSRRVLILGAVRSNIAGAAGPNDNQVEVRGGIYRGAGGAPVLGDIPMIGDLFRTQNSVAGQTSLGAGGAGGAGIVGLTPLSQTGARAVGESLYARDLKKGYAAPIADAGTKILGGKTFVWKNGVWTDTAFDAAKFADVKVVKFGSDAYFALLDDEKVAPWLSAGEQVVFVQNGVAVRVEK